MLSIQKHLFQLPDDIHYLNGAYMSPLLKSVEQAGIKGIMRKRNPAEIKADDFFSEAEIIKSKIGRIINASSKQIALVPSASYGLKAAINNLPLDRGNHAITVANEFPSGYYTLLNWCITNKKELKVIGPDNISINRGKEWNENILGAINHETTVVLLSSIHWIDGTSFDLQKIGERCKEVNALFIVDGTQSIGALPIDVVTYKIDALVCAAYKWLLGPYSTGFAYFSEFFNEGIPLENTWMNKSNVSDFANLTSYINSYSPGAGRYNSGEFSNFALLPMMHAAVDQILQWGVGEIQDYCSSLVIPLVKLLKQKECWIEDVNYRANHLFGFSLPQGVDSLKLTDTLHQRKIIVSLRNSSIRVSPNVYNSEDDIEALSEALFELL